MKLTPCAISATLGLFCAAPLMAERISLYWEGSVSSVTSFSPDAVPVGVQQGVQVSGSLIFDSDQSTGSAELLGTNIFGEQYAYAGDLIQSINIGSLEWDIRGGVISLIIDSSNGSQQAFDVLTTSTSGLDSFPNYAGYAEAGFAVFDDAIPLALFDSYDIANTNIDLSQVTYGSGMLSTRYFDQNGDITDGYYLDFSITNIALAPIPEPSDTACLFGISALVLFSVKKRRAIIAKLGGNRRDA